MKVKIKKTLDNARIPTYGTDGAACFDFYATSEADVFALDTSELLDTGIAVEVPDGHVLLAFSRSGHGFKNGLRLCNSVGVIDSDYRDSIKVKLVNDSCKDYVIEEGERILQGMIIPVERITFDLVEELSETVRGIGGLGSTGR